MNTGKKSIDLYVGPAGINNAIEFARTHVESVVNIHVDKTMIGNGWRIVEPVMMKRSGLATTIDEAVDIVSGWANDRKAVFNIDVDGDTEMDVSLFQGGDV